MQVVDMHRVLRYVVGKIVTLAVADTRLDTSTRHPDSEAPRVMVPAIRFIVKNALTVGAAPELAPPNHKRVI